MRNMEYDKNISDLLEKRIYEKTDESVDLDKLVIYIKRIFEGKHQDTYTIVNDFATYEDVLNDRTTFENFGLNIVSDVFANTESLYKSLKYMVDDYLNYSIEVEFTEAIFNDYYEQLYLDAQVPLDYMDTLRQEHSAYLDKLNGYKKSQRSKDAFNRNVSKAMCVAENGSQIIQPNGDVLNIPVDTVDGADLHTDVTKLKMYLYQISLGVPSPIEEKKPEGGDEDYGEEGHPDTPTSGDINPPERH